jgi:hypothetical protein
MPFVSYLKGKMWASLLGLTHCSINAKSHCCDLVSGDLIKEDDNTLPEKIVHSVTLVTVLQIWNSISIAAQRFAGTLHFHPNAKSTGVACCRAAMSRRYRNSLILSRRVMKVTAGEVGFHAAVLKDSLWATRVCLGYNLHLSLTHFGSLILFASV